MERITRLIIGYLEGSLNKKEKVDLEEWVSDSNENRALFEELTSEEGLLQGLKKIEMEKMAADLSVGKEKVIRKPFYKHGLLKYAAIFLIGSLGAAAWLHWGNLSKKKIITAENITQGQADILPGNNRATLTLANGSKIILDNAINGTIAQQGASKVFKLNNSSLSYSTKLAPSDDIQAELLNTITTPRGGQYQVILSDGSKVWLNAGSTIRFPIYFTSAIRHVELSGEAYFEVAKNPKKPFIVAVGTMNVEVVGTHFNIMAYTDERETKTSLMEGAVKVSIEKASKFLKPGQQSRVDKNGTISVIENADMDEAISWKNGYFQFNGADIHSILRQISRWYDVDVEAAGEIPGHFNATIPRDVPISKLFKVLSLTGHVHFRIEGQKIIVAPQD